MVAQGTLSGEWRTLCHITSSSMPWKPFYAVLGNS